MLDGITGTPKRRSSSRQRVTGDEPFEIRS
jgi:hypothetical protein